MERQEQVAEAQREQRLSADDWTPDDALRFQSVMCALSRALDKVTTCSFPTVLSNTAWAR